MGNYLDVGTFQNDMTSIRQRDDVLTLLVHLGYLAYSSMDKTGSIPNEEVRQEFIRAVVTGRHKEVAKLVRDSDQLLERTLNMDEEGVADYGGDILLVGISYHANSKRHTCKIERFCKNGFSDAF